jgi:Flp pilus assembly protein TadG
VSTEMIVSVFKPMLKKFSTSESGVAAVEMGIMTPFLVFGLVMMLDVGLAINERMNLDQDVRAGVQAAVSNITEPGDIQSLILATAADDAQNMTVSVARRCTCGSVASSCTATLCSGGTPPFVFLDISAQKLHRGIIFPDYTLDSETSVQIR